MGRRFERLAAVFSFLWPCFGWMIEGAMYGGNLFEVLSVLDRNDEIWSFGRYL